MGTDDSSSPPPVSTSEERPRLLSRFTRRAWSEPLTFENGTRSSLPSISLKSCCFSSATAAFVGLRSWVFLLSVISVGLPISVGLECCARRPVGPQKRRGGGQPLPYREG